MRKFTLQLAIFATIMGTIGFALKNDLTFGEKLFILITAYNATMYFSLQLDLLKLMEEKEND